MLSPGVQSFRVKLILLTTVTSTVAVLLVCGVFVVREKAALRASTIENLSIQAQAIATHSAASLLFGDKDAGTETLTALAAEPDITAAFIFSDNGEVFARFQAKPEESIPPINPDATRYYFDHDRLVLSCPIVHAEEFLGTLTILYDMRSVYALARQNIVIAITIALLAILVSFAMYSRRGKGLEMSK